MVEQKARTTLLPIWWVVGGVFVFMLVGCSVVALASLFFVTRSSPQAARVTISPGGAKVANSQNMVVTPAPLVIVATPENGVDYESAVLINIYTQVGPSVVNVTNLTLPSSLSNSPNPFHGDNLLPLSGGSGFVWDNSGHIVTNNHVVEGADEVQVTFSDGLVAVAELVGSDPDSDLAVLKIEPEGYRLNPVRRGRLEDVRVGMRVAAIGNPFGLEGTLTSGIVSAIGRTIPALAQFSIPNSIQTDAPINPGNSGGPLLNERGEVIGVNAQIRSETGVNSGVGFAIPITLVERVIPALIADKKYEHSYLGVRGATLSPLCAENLELPKTARGAYIREVLRNTPAARAGLQAGNEPLSNGRYEQICPQERGGDLILGINDQPVTAFDDVLSYLENYTSPGDTVTLRILRDSEEILVDVTLAPRPRSP
jgi:2-alkenal reductase